MDGGAAFGSPVSYRDSGETSPARERVRAISSKLQDLQRSMSNERRQRRQALESRLKTLEERILRTEERMNSQLRHLRESVASAADERQQDAAAFKEAESRLAADVDSVRGEITTGISGLKKDQSELRSSTEKKLLDLEESLTQERRARQEGVEQTHSTLAAEIRRVSDAADARGDEREAEKKHRESMEAEMRELRQDLGAERQVREELERTIMGMMEDMHSKFSQELERQKRERAATEQQILQVLEETCTRVEAECMD